MVRVTESVLNQMLRSALKNYPKECCGILASKKGSRLIQAAYAIKNSAAGNRAFHMDPAGLIRVFKELRQKRRRLAGIYHSHPDSFCRPSKADLKGAGYSRVSYFILSLREKRQAVLKSYRICGSAFRAQVIRVVKK